MALLAVSIAVSPIHLGVVRTVELAASPVSANDLKLYLHNWSDPPPATYSPWLINTEYPDLQRVRGILSTPKGDAKAFRIRARSLARPHSVTDYDCYEPTPDADCFFVVMLEPGDAASGIEVEVIGKGANAPRSFSHVFRFERRTRYSTLFYESLMGI